MHAGYITYSLDAYTTGTTASVPPHCSSAYDAFTTPSNTSDQLLCEPAAACLHIAIHTAMRASCCVPTHRNPHCQALRPARNPRRGAAPGPPARPSLTCALMPPQADSSTAPGSHCNCGTAHAHERKLPAAAPRRARVPLFTLSL
eukprot:147002-Chlamydomonas_euryale.AAC.4